MVFAAVVILADLAPVGVVGGAINNRAGFAGLVLLGAIDGAAGGTMVLTTVVNLTIGTPVGMIGGAIQSTAFVANLMLRGAVDSAAGRAMVLAAVVLLAISAPSEMFRGTAHGTTGGASCFCCSISRCFRRCNGHIGTVRRISRSREDAHNHQEGQQE